MHVKTNHYIVSVVFSSTFLLSFYSCTRIHSPTYSEQYVRTHCSPEIYLQFHVGPNVDDYVRYPYDDALSIAKHPKFNKSIKTVWHFPGWSEKPRQHNNSISALATAFLRKKRQNFLVWDYSNLLKAGSNLKYILSVWNITSIGRCLGQFYDNYIGVVQPIKLQHLIGHSLGCHILSHTARTYGPGRFPHLTGLDPAGPMFNLPFVTRLSKRDGKFVDLIHTDAGFYGLADATGTVDFFPNNGRQVQPYCKNHDLNNAFCNHHMSWKYYAESILKETAFPAIRCAYANICFLPNICGCLLLSPIATYMGYGISKKTVPGRYYLTTANVSYFGLGRRGI